PASLSRSRREQQRMITWKAVKEAYQRRHLKLDTPPPSPLGSTAMDLHLRWAILALTAGYYRTARKYAWRQFRKAPSRRVLKALAEATLRSAAEPFAWVYDLARLRKPRSGSRPDDKVPSEELVRRYTGELERLATGLAAEEPGASPVAK